MNEDITAKLNALTAYKSNWREKVRANKQFVEAFQKLQEDKKLVREMFKEGKSVEEIEQAGIKFSNDEWWEQFQKGYANPQSKEITDKWWTNMTDEEREQYLIDVVNHI